MKAHFQREENTIYHFLPERPGNKNRQRKIHRNKKGQNPRKQHSEIPRRHTGPKNGLQKTHERKKSHRTQGTCNTEIIFRSELPAVIKQRLYQSTLKPIILYERELFQSNTPVRQSSIHTHREA